jgi:hypothetical protein
MLKSEKSSEEAMSTALILHSIREADACVQRRLHDGCLLLSTNPSVAVYLKERHALDCLCVNRFLTHAELAGLMKTASSAADRVLASLDERIAPFLNEQLGLKMRYFTPAYSFMGRHYLLGHVAFIEALRKIITAHHVDKILVSDSRYQDFLNVDPGMAALLARFFPQIACETIALGGAGGAEGSARLRRLLRTARDPSAWPALLSKAARALGAQPRRRAAAGAKSILLCEPLYFLGFLADALDGYDLIHCSVDGYPAGVLSRMRRPEVRVNREKLHSLLSETREEPFEDFLSRGIREDFTKGLAAYLQPALAVKKIHESAPLSLAVWGNIGGYSKYLLFEYLRSAGVKIVGTQHGNSYGDQIAPWAWVSDFDRCDHFISWGFTKDDLSRVYPDAKPRFEVHPMGSVLPKPVQSEKIKIDVLFPMTWSMSMFDGGAGRIKPDALIERQVKILEYLNSLKGVRVCVKPPPGTNPDNCVALSLARRLSNLQILENAPLTRFLEKYEPRIVIVEYPASPLYQSLRLDADILLMPDLISPYEERARAEVSERVHFCADAEAVIAKLELFLAGRLEKKRDDTYYRHYIHQPDARENTLRLIKGLADGRFPVEPARAID